MELRWRGLLLGFALILAGAVAGTGCARPQDQSQVTLKLDFKDFPTARSEQVPRASGPHRPRLTETNAFETGEPTTTIPSNYCYAVLVEWDDDTTVANWCEDYAGNIRMRPRQLYGFFNPTETTTLTIPAGKARKFYVMGVAKKPGLGESCPPVEAIPYDVERTFYAPRFIGATTVDLLKSSETVEMRVSLTNSIKVGECTGPFFDWANDESTYPSSLSAILPTPTDESSAVTLGLSGSIVITFKYATNLTSATYATTTCSSTAPIQIFRNSCTDQTCTESCLPMRMSVSSDKKRVTLLPYGTTWTAGTQELRLDIRPLFNYYNGSAWVPFEGYLTHGYQLADSICLNSTFTRYNSYQIDGYYILCNQIQLQDLIKAGSVDGVAFQQNYKVMSNLDLGSLTGSIGTQTYPYRGLFVAASENMTLANYKRAVTDTTPVGLFGVISTGALIDRFHLQSFQVSGGGYVGSLVGAMYGGEVLNIGMQGIASEAYPMAQGSATVGGLVGYLTGDSHLMNIRWQQGAVVGSLTSALESGALGGIVGAAEGSNVVLEAITTDPGTQVKATVTHASHTGVYRLGGAIGWVGQAAKVSDLQFEGDLKFSRLQSVSGQSYIGGVIGEIQATSPQSYSNLYGLATISSGSWLGSTPNPARMEGAVGGVIGRAVVDDALTFGRLKSDSDFYSQHQVVGGVIGELAMTNPAGGNVKVHQSLYGEANLSATNTNALASLYAGGSHVSFATQVAGGLIGRITSAASTGSIHLVDNYVHGRLMLLAANISNGFSTTNVLGGLVGVLDLSNSGGATITTYIKNNYVAGVLGVAASSAAQTQTAAFVGHAKSYPHLQIYNNFSALINITAKNYNPVAQFDSSGDLNTVVGNNLFLISHAGVAVTQGHPSYGMITLAGLNYNGGGGNLNVTSLTNYSDASRSIFTAAPAPWNTQESWEILNDRLPQLKWLYEQLP